mgnify:CR=1 FL=1
MLYLDPHIHMVSRTTDDYEQMAAAGVKAIGSASGPPTIDDGLADTTSPATRRPRNRRVSTSSETSIPDRASA